MHSRLLLASIALAGTAASAGAACSDSLFLQSITVYRQSLKNTTTLGAWDSVEVDAWDSAAVTKAAPISLTPYEGLFLSPFDTLDHELKLSSNCGSDSVGPVLSARLTTDTSSTGSYAWKSTVSSQRHEGSAKVTWKWIRNGAYQWKVGSETLWANDVWDSPDFTLASDTVTKTIVGWKFRSLGFAIKKPTVYGSGLPAVPNVDVKANSRTETPFRKVAENYLTGTILPSFQSSVDAIGNGSIDSTRLELRLYRSVFAKASSTALAPRARHSKTFAVAPIANGWSIQLTRATPVSIYSTDGRLVRQFPAARSVVWDGRDASGAKVRPGLWVVRASGLGAMPVLVR